MREVGEEKVRIVCLDIDQRGRSLYVRAQEAYLPAGHPLYNGFKRGDYKAELEPYWEGKGAIVYMTPDIAKELVGQISYALKTIHELEEEGGKK